MTSDWQSWCRLCAKCEYYEQFIPMESVADLELIVEKYFYISIMVPDIVNSICTECYQFLITLEKYSERCRNVDKMFNELANRNDSLDLMENDAHLIRFKYAVDVDEKMGNLLEIAKSTTDHKVNDSVDLLNIDLSASVQRKLQMNCEIENDELTTVRKKRGRPKKSIAPLTLKVEQINSDISDIDVPDFDADDSNNDPSFEIDQKHMIDDDEEEDDVDPDDEELSNSDDKLNKKRKARNRRDRNLPIVCNLCNKEFLVQKLYDVHLKSDHPGAQLPFPCPKCPKRFSSLAKVQRHEFVHLPDAEKLLHPCPYCDKRFTKAVNVQAHVRAIHIGDRPFICEECGKSFGTKGALKEHQITHSDEFPFQCSHCPKKFKNLARLRTHADIHKDTVYVCPHCGLQLNTKRTLKMHMVVHSDQKKYKCQYCGNEYKRSKALKNHLILHTGLRPYTCPFCEKTFANGSNCRSHKKKAHPLELAELEASGQVTRATNIPKLEHLQPKKDILNTQMEDVIETIAQDDIILPPQLLI